MIIKAQPVPVDGESAHQLYRLSDSLASFSIRSAVQMFPLKSPFGS